MEFVSGNNHGSAAVVRHVQHPTTAALLPTAGGAMITQPPTAVDVIGAATGAEHSTRSDSSHVRRASPSALGAELSDDSLTMSPEEQRPQMRGATKRDARARMPSGKRLALSLPRPTRRDSPSTHEGRERSPRARGPKSLEERVLAIELQSAYDRPQGAAGLQGRPRGAHQDWLRPAPRGLRLSGRCRRRDGNN